MVTVPAHAAADVQQDLIEPRQHGGQLVGHNFRRMKMARIEAQQLAVAERVAEVEFVRTHHVALGAEAEELAFDRIALLLRIHRLGKNRVERFGKPLPRTSAVDRRILGAVGNPDVRHARRAQRPAQRRTDAPANDAMLNPETANGRIAMSQGKTVGRLGMSEEGWIEVKPQAAAACPLDPVAKMGRLQLIAVHNAAAGLGITGVQVDAMLAGHEGQRLFQVGPQLLGRACPSGIVAGNRQAAAQFRAAALKAGDIVPLPAVQRDADAGEPVQGPGDIDTQLGEALFGLSENMLAG
jgi:hypothetical protein